MIIAIQYSDFLGADYEVNWFFSWFS